MTTQSRRAAFATGKRPPAGHRPWWAALTVFCLLAIAMSGGDRPALAQNVEPRLPDTNWQSDLLRLDPPAPTGAGSTTVTKQPAPPPAAGPPGSSLVRLIALLTADGQRIDNDLVWRIFEESRDAGRPGKLLHTFREAAPAVRLMPGNYVVNAAFGRAHITRKITVSAAVEATEPFVLNAGGLRVQMAGSSGKIDSSKATFDIMSDERDQSGNRTVVLSRAKPGVVVRLNSGIYHVVSTYGDANAVVASDVTVEAGKLTEMTITHRPARITLKLVTRQGGEALPDTSWTLMTADGRTVKESVGALPTHFIAPGSYLAIAKTQGQVFRREFAVKEDDVAEIEVLRQ